MNIVKLFLALFTIAVLTAGCTIAPVRYVTVATAPAAEQQPVVVTPTVVYVQQQPLYYNPVFDVAAGYLIWRGLTGGHGYHRR